MQTKHVLAGLLAAAAHLDAWAQNGQDPAREHEPGESPSRDVRDPTADLDRIIVTAQYRDENAQRIPLAISLASGESLEARHATDISSLAHAMASVTFSSGNELRNNSIRIRGVGTDVFSTGVEPSISTVVDGVVLQRPGAAFADLYDIERIEVLRGPQGTLFGRNASAGVVSVITRPLDYAKVSGEASGLLAEAGGSRFVGAVSGPLGDGLAYRIAAFHREQQASVSNLYSDRKVNGQYAHGARGKLGWRSEDEQSEILFNADYSALDSSCCALPLLRASDNPRSLATGTVPGDDNDEVNNDISPFVRQRSYGASLTARTGWSGYQLTSITAWRRYDNRSNVDLDDTQARLISRNFNVENSRTTSQELRLASPLGAAADFVIGAYYADGRVFNRLDRRGLNITGVERIDWDGQVVPLVQGDSAVLAGQSVVDNRNLSLFGQGNWRPFAKVTLTAGARLINERQALHFLRPQDGYFNGISQNATNPAFGPVVGYYHDSALIGRVAASYAFSPRVMGYVSYGTGYKGEGLAATLGLTAAQFERLPAPAETSRSFEAGLKTSLLNGALMFNATRFHTRIDDYQAQAYDALPGLFLLTSAGSVLIDGVELEFVATPHANVSFNASVAWLDARFQGATNGPCYTGQTPAQGCMQTGGGGQQDLSGKPVMNAPRLRYTFSGRYEVPFSANDRGYLQLDYRWQDRVVLDISQNPSLMQAAYGVADLSAGMLLREGKYDVSLYIKNLGNQHYAANRMVVSTAGGINAYAQQLPSDFHRYAGLSFRMSF